MSELVIEHREEADHGQFFILGSDGRVLAELDYQRRGETWVASHTGVREELRGQGVARRLVEALVTEARARKVVIEPRCSYVRRVLTETSGAFSDVLPEGLG